MTGLGDIMAAIKNSNGEVSMTMKTTKSPKSSGWLAKASRVLIFTLIASIFMPLGWYCADEAAAALSVKQGTFVKNSALGAQSITGIGFQPKAVIFYWTRQTAVGYLASISSGYGFAADGAPITMAAVSTQALDNQATTDSNNAHYSTASIVLQNTASGGAVNNLGTITAFGADGFTVNWSAAGTADIISYVALGGSDITNAKVGTTSMFALTGNSSVTGVGFQPDTAFLMSSVNGNTLNAVTAALRTGTTFGFMSSASTATTQGSLSWGNRDARTATGYIGSIWSNTNYSNLRATAIDVVATLGSWDVDGFTMNASAAPNLAHNVSWLALKGGKFRLGSLAQPGATGNQVISGVGFQPLAVMFASANLNSASGTLSTAAAKQSFGAGTVTSQSGQWIGSAGTINSDENMLLRNGTAVLLSTGPTTTNAAATLTALSADGFTLNWTQADATARNVLYIAMGSGCGAVTPTGLAAGTLTPTSVPLTWNTDANNNYYRVYRGGVQINVDGATTTGSYTDNTASVDGAYSYTVSGYNTAGACESAQSTAVPVNTPAVTPVAPTVANPQLTTLDVTINTETPANPTSVTYAIRINGGAYTNQYVQANGSVGASAVWQAKATWATKTVTGLANGTAYNFDVQARNTALTATSFGSAAGGSTTSPCAAVTPTSLAVVAGTTTTSIPLTWTTSAGSDSYNVYRDAVKISTDGAVTTGSYTDATASPSKTYIYTVKGYNNAGTCESGASNSATKSTLAVTPSAPTLANTGTGNSANVTVGSDTNSTEATYAIRINGGAYTNQFVQAGGAVGASAVWQTKAAWSTKTVTGLTDTVNYTFDVEARNGNGELIVSSPAFGSSAIVNVHVSQASSISSCGDCHGTTGAYADGTARNNPAGTFPGSHNTHVVVYGKSCTTCHPNNTTYDHRNATVDMVSPLGGGGTGAYNRGSFAQVNNSTGLTTCSNTYCHSNGTSVISGSIPANTSTAWGGTTSCESCHGAGGGDDGRPNYANNTPKRNTHGDGASYGVTHKATPCDTCHIGVSGSAGAYAVDAATHNNGVYNLQGAVGYTQATGVCSTASCHGSVAWGGSLGCMDCHTAAINSPVAQGLDATVTQRRAIVPEFARASNHKRSGGSTVTNEDCGVCHMEGNASTGAINATYHKNGTLELRDPDLGATIKQVSFTGTPGSYSSTATDAKPVRFSRDLAVRPEAEANFATIAAIQVNLCIKCHDSGGATSNTAWVPSGTATKPFNTTVAANPGGGVLDVASQFASSNRSYHPVLAKQNNSYTANTRMNAPWNATKTNGNSTSWGYLMTCWDCHAPNGATGVLTETGVHGGTLAGTDVVPMRGQTYNTGTTAATNYCFTCHAGYTDATWHLAGSAFSPNRATMGGIADSCFICHSSAIAAAQPARPIGASDAHGFTTRSTGAAFPAVSNGYAFVRSEGFYGSTYQHLVRQIGATTYSPNCTGYTAGGICAGRNGMGTYTPGGVY